MGGSWEESDLAYQRPSVSLVSSEVEQAGCTPVLGPYSPNCSPLLDTGIVALYPLSCTNIY